MHKIKELREAKGLTQEHVAQQLGVTQGTVANWETGARTPTLANLVRVADILGVSLDEVYGRTAVS